MVRLFSFLFLFTFSFSSFSQSVYPDKPKLAVGIIVDQMRYDYLVRFRPWFSANGFVRLLDNGSNFTFAHYNYEPTYTGPGHASVYTGSTPFYHGIISNDWYDRRNKKDINCVGDSTVASVGTDSKEGLFSPRNLLASTITDQLKLSNNGLSKVISVSIKNRGAILPGGHLSNGSFWYDGTVGKFVTSTYFMKELPKWVTDFNNRKLPDEILKRTWNPLLDISNYQINMPDSSAFESDPFNEQKTTFPHHLDKIKEKDKYWNIITTPFGDEFLLEFAKSAIVNENLGKGKYTDFFAISFSSTDWIGHAFGAQSMEIMDEYIRLDRRIAELLDLLDKQVGAGNYTLFLSADHAGTENKQFLQERGFDSLTVQKKPIVKSVKKYLEKTYGSDKLLEKESNHQLFLNWQLMNKMKINPAELEQNLRRYLRMEFPDLAGIYLRSELEGKLPKRDGDKELNGFNVIRSGDIILTVSPGKALGDKPETGGSHGSPYSTDTHIPMLFYGWGIPKQTVNTPAFIVDIAPTMADVLGINEPNGCYGIPLIQRQIK